MESDVLRPNLYLLDNVYTNYVVCYNAFGLMI